MIKDQNNRPAHRREVHRVLRTGEQLTWYCQECGQPIRRGEGYLATDQDQAERHERWAHDEATTTGWITGAELLDIPYVSLWRVSHTGCGLDSRLHLIDPPETQADLFRLTAHLIRKGWISDTDWPSLLEEASRSTR